MVQLSSVNAIHCTDINDDGKIDMVIGGNEFDFHSSIGAARCKFWVMC